MPIWVRAPGVIALVLVAVAVSAMLVGAAREPESHMSPGGNEPRQNQEQQIDPGGVHDPSQYDHG